MLRDTIDKAYISETKLPIFQRLCDHFYPNEIDYENEYNKLYCYISPVEYLTSSGGIGVRYIGNISGCYGRLPILDYTRAIPHRIILLKIENDIDWGASPIIYQHPHYDELVKDTVFAP